MVVLGGGGLFLMSEVPRWGLRSDIQGLGFREKGFWFIAIVRSSPVATFREGLQ